MKNILRTSIFALLLFAAGSCSENDKDPVVSNHEFVLRAPDAVSPIVLSPQTIAAVVATLAWDKSDNGVSAVPTYTIEVTNHATDPNFASPIALNSGNNIDISTARSYVLTVGELNTVTSQLPGLVCGAPTLIDIRVKSKLGIVENNAFVQYSTPITITVSTFSADLPLMSFATTAVGAGIAPKMAASSILTADYEGYMYLQPGNYFFYRGDACNGFATPTAYGDDGLGSFDTLVVNGAGYTISAAGVYRVKVDLTTLNYAVTPITAFGIIGLAKTSGTATSNPPLVYDVANNIYRSAPIGIDLRGGKTFRFRANNSNVINLGRFDATKTGVDYGGAMMSYSGLDISVPGLTIQRYDITLDLSSPRDYKYTLTLH